MTVPTQVKLLINFGENALSQEVKEADYDYCLEKGWQRLVYSPYDAWEHHPGRGAARDPCSY